MDYILFSGSDQRIEFLEEIMHLYDIQALESMTSNVYSSTSSRWAEEENGVEKTQAFLKVYASDDVLDQIEKEYSDGKRYSVVEEDWLKKWKEGYKPTHIGSYRFIAPHHDRKNIDKEIIINPSMAFGTGDHDTTKSMVLAIESLGGIRGTCYDVGCGSGILSMVLIKEGADKVIGIEIDEDALKNAYENLELNKLDNIIFKRSSLLENEVEKADVICANILPHILVEMKNDALRLLKDDGYLILGGILLEKKQEVIDNFSAFKVVDEFILGQWMSLVLKV